jgi:hypothetical protein
MQKKKQINFLDTKVGAWKERTLNFVSEACAEALIRGNEELKTRGVTSAHAMRFRRSKYSV